MHWDWFLIVTLHDCHHCNNIIKIANIIKTDSASVYFKGKILKTLVVHNGEKTETNFNKGLGKGGEFV